MAKHWLLNLIYAALLLLLLPWILWRSFSKGRYRNGWNQKLFGQLPDLAKNRTERNAGQTGPKTIWFHAVSVGELQVIRPLVERATKQWPKAKLLITTSTDSGFELAQKLYIQHAVSFAPMDFSWAVSRALDKVQPDMIVLAELELWPNWISLAAKRNIPLVVINGRLSQKSLRGYLRIAPLARSIIQKISWIGAQSDTIRDRFLQLGYDAAKIDVVGNIKFDGANHDRLHPEVRARAEQLKLTDPMTRVWLCGSTQAPEEKICLDTFCEIAVRFPSLKLILVPRHAERFDEVAKMVSHTKLAWARRSAMADQAIDPNWRVFLADSVGELRWWWGLADLGFVGGSFGSRGGQNMIEPCAYGVATCYGPNTRNFTDIVQILQEAGAATELPDPDALKPWIIRMIEDQPSRSMITQRAVAVTQQHRGATDRTWEKILEILN
ncbi:MAG: 3-deoxy-D-manno-octulosonic acid transferase [Planctomycetota bacterium]|jgi:3-deoxy-D-manno-octulosonic-acid transferase